MHSISQFCDSLFSSRNTHNGQQQQEKGREDHERAGTAYSKNEIVKSGDVFKVDSFLNRQMDIQLVDEMDAEAGTVTFRAQ